MKNTVKDYKSEIVNVMGCEGEIIVEQCMTRVGGNHLTASNYRVPLTLYVLCICHCTSSSEFVCVTNKTLFADFIMLQLMCLCQLFTAPLPFGTGVVVDNQTEVLIEVG